MRTEALEYYCEIARNGSITQAAGNLFISQQGLSKAIVGLEKELGVTLLRKTGRGVELTDEGVIFHSYARKILSLYRECKDTLCSVSAGEEALTFSDLQICVMPYVCNAFFEVFEAELSEYGLGEGDLTVQEMNAVEIREGFSAGSIDFALVNMLEEDFAEAANVAKVVPLFSAEVLLVVPQGIADSLPETAVSASMLADVPFAYYNEPVLNRVVARFSAGSAVESPRLHQHSSNAKSIRRLVESGKAVTFSDTFVSLRRKQMEGTVALRMKPAQRFFVCFLVNPDYGEATLQWAYIRRMQAMLHAKCGISNLGATLL